MVLEAVARSRSAAQPTERTFAIMKEQINPKHGPQAVGPYSPAIRANGFVFVSGQIAIQADTGLILRGSIEEQVRQTLENLKTLLEAAGSSLEKAVKVTVFLKDMENFEAMNAVYAEFFGQSKPARSTVEVARLPKDVDVEMDVIAMA